VLMSKVEVAPELKLEVDVVTPLVVVRVARVMVLVTPCDATTTMDVPTWVTMVIGGASVTVGDAVVKDEVVPADSDFDPGDAVTVVVAVVAADGVGVVVGAMVDEVAFVDVVDGSAARTATP